MSSVVVKRLSSCSAAVTNDSRSAISRVRLSARKQFVAPPRGLKINTAPKTNPNALTSLLQSLEHPDDFMTL
jgi:hypothetical protein